MPGGEVAWIDAPTSTPHLHLSSHPLASQLPRVCKLWSAFTLARLSIDRAADSPSPRIHRSCRTPTTASASPFVATATAAMSLQSYVNKKILIITADSRTLVGTLLSCDQMTNLVLQDTWERIIRPADDPEPSQQIQHGLYLIRGDNVTLCGLVDEELDESIDWNKVRGEVIGSTKHV
ncbi:hypothetical protein IWZ01DRAFT_250815 [Phyllosticta capitalensis]